MQHLRKPPSWGHPVIGASWGCELVRVRVGATQLLEGELLEGELGPPSYWRVGGSVLGASWGHPVIGMLGCRSPLGVTWIPDFDPHQSTSRLLVRARGESHPDQKPRRSRYLVGSNSGPQRLHVLFSLKAKANENVLDAPRKR